MVSNISSIVSHIAVKKSDRYVKQSRPVNNGTAKAPAGNKMVKRSNSTKTRAKSPDAKSKTLPRSNSVRQKSDVAKAGSKSSGTAQNKSQTLPRPKKTEQGVRSPSRPSNINLAAGPGPRKMGKGVTKQQKPGTRA